MLACLRAPRARPIPARTPSQPQPLREPVKATLDHLTVAIVPQRTASSLPAQQVLTGSLQVCELAVALADVEMYDG